MKSSYFPQSVVEESESTSDSSYIKNFSPSAQANYRSPLKGRSNFHCEAPNNDPQLPIMYPAHNHNDGLIHFPSNTQVLWDRTALAAPIFISPVDAIPNLILGGREVKKLLSLLNPSYDLPANSSSGTFNANAYIYHASNLPNSHQALVNLLSRGIIQGRSQYYLSFERHQIPDLQLTIPISCSDEGQCNSILSLQDNLWKAISSSKEFGIKHFLRIRAQGSVSNSNANNQDFSLRSTSDSISGKMRFEAIVPDISLQILPINPLPILSTAMSAVLFDPQTLNPKQPHVCTEQQQHSSSQIRVDARLASVEASNMGYVTLNQTRKVVFLAESEASLSNSQMVGVWVRLAPLQPTNSGSYSGEYDWQELAKHPYCWAACVRFVYHQRIWQRVCVAQDTFLLTMLVGDAVYFCEVTVSVSGSDGITAATTVFTPEGIASRINFVHMDFTTSLSTENDIDLGRSDDQLGGVICRFKPVSTPFTRYPRAFQEQYNNKSNDDNMLTPESSPKRFNLLSPSLTHNHNNAHSNNMEMKDQQRTNGILPELNPQIMAKPSLDIPAGAFSALQTARKIETVVPMDTAHKLPVAYYHDTAAIQAQEWHQLRTLGMTDEEKQYFYPVFPGTEQTSGICRVEESLQYRFPAEIITAQQRQIQLLQEEVASLREMVKLLTAASLQSNNSNNTNTINNVNNMDNGGNFNNISDSMNSNNTVADNVKSADEVSVLFDSFQRQVINVLRASHEEKSLSSKPPLPIIGSEASTFLRDAPIFSNSIMNNTNKNENNNENIKEKNDIVNDGNGRYSFENEEPEEEDDDIITNNKDYDEGEIEFYVRRNFTSFNSVPSTSCTSTNSAVAVSADNEINTVENMNEKKDTRKNASTNNKSGVLSNDIPKKKSLVPAANKKQALSPVKETKITPKGAVKLSSKLIVSQVVEPSLDTLTDDVDIDMADIEGRDFSEDSNLLTENELMRDLSATRARAVPPRHVTFTQKPMSSPVTAKISNNSGNNSQWIDEAEKSFRESESIMAIESRYR